MTRVDPKRDIVAEYVHNHRLGERFSEARARFFTLIGLFAGCFVFALIAALVLF